jgi:uncharacterized protein YndB with AHSA1/START domain
MDEAGSRSVAGAEGAYGVVTGPGEMRFERLLPGPIERVWEFLTDSGKRALWLAGGEMEQREGGKLELHFLHSSLSPDDERVPERYRQFENGAINHCTVTRYEPPRRLSLDWEEGGGEHSEVSIVLTPKGDHVLLTLTHRRLLTREMMVDVAAGWHTHLGILTDRLAGLDPKPFWSAHERLEGEYERRLPGEPR